MAEFISTWAPAAGVAVIAGVGYAMFQSLQPPVAKSRAQTPKSAKAAKQTKETVVVSSTVHAKGTAPGPANAEKRRKKASVHAAAYLHAISLPTRYCFSCIRKATSSHLAAWQMCSEQVADSTNFFIIFFLFHFFQRRLPTLPYTNV